MVGYKLLTVSTAQTKSTRVGRTFFLEEVLYVYILYIYGGCAVCPAALLPEYCCCCGFLPTVEQSRNLTKRGELFHTPHLAEQSLMYVNFLCFAD